MHITYHKAMADVDGYGDDPEAVFATRHKIDMIWMHNIQIHILVLNV